MTLVITLLVHPNMDKVLSRLIDTLNQALRDIGFDVILSNELKPNFTDRAIIFGANFYSLSDLCSIKRDSIIFNVENIASKFMTDEYIHLLKNFHVWDYSDANAIELSEALGRRVHYLKLFYLESLARVPHRSHMDIDVLFYGSFNARRSAILDELRARGLTVTAVFDVWGKQLDELIERSKVIINIHFYDNGHLEIIRLFDLLANRRAVVSEFNDGELIDADLANSFVAVPYEELVDATESLVRDPTRRDQVAMAGFRAFASRDPTLILQEALAKSTTPVIPSQAMVGSGKAYDPKLLNIDINERWYPDIVADIMDKELFERRFLSPRFGSLRLSRGWFDAITVSDVLEHLPDLVTAMTNLLDLLSDGGTLRVDVPYDLSYGAWQDPTHVRAFNERSWLYYCEWYWYLGWTDFRFEIIALNFHYSAVGQSLSAQNLPQDEILRTPRAVDAMHVVLRKRPLTDEERAYGRTMRGDTRAVPC